jgi:regulatory protein
LVLNVIRFIPLSQYHTVMEPTDEAYAKIVRLLAVRSHSEAELRRKLTSRQFGESDIAPALARGRADGYVDDERFAFEFARYGRDRKNWAPHRTEQELRQRGVASGLIDLAIAAVFENFDLREQALELARAKVQRMTGDIEACRRRLGSFLSRRGYSFSLCRDVVDEVAPLP